MGGAAGLPPRAGNFVAASRSSSVSRVVSLFVIALAACPTPARAQTGDESSRSALSESDRQFQTCREGLLDPQARPDERKRWVELLFSYDLPQATALIAELLALPPRPEVQVPICDALTARGRESSDALAETFIDPLIQLLGGEGDELRAAAARALAEFPGAEVPNRLGALAARADVPLIKRLAAIDALAPNTHRRDVVAQLMALLGLEVPAVSDRVVTVLEPLAPRSFGNNVIQWRAWWDAQMRMDEKVWLAEQLRLYRDRARKLSVDLQGRRSEAEREEVAEIVRIRDFQRELLRPLTPEQREARLVEWIDDPLLVVKSATLGIVRSRIADEGKRPDGEVLHALLRLLKHESAGVRRESLQILQNLSDAAVVEAVVGRLNDEKDSGVRQTVFQALGRIGSVTAIPALLREVGAAGSSPECVREAAVALGQIALKPESAEHLKNASLPLLDRYRSAPPDQVALQGALLSAMAGVGDPAFADEFARAVESDDVGLLQAALRGLRAVGEASKLPRCRALMSHTDARVRLAAIEVVGQLGREDADLEALQARLNPAVEGSEIGREAAWRGFRQLLAKRPVPDRIRAAERLRETPDLAVRYLEELVIALAASGNHLAELDAVRDRLSAILIAAGKDAEAATHLRELFAARLSRGDPTAKAAGLRWLEATLRTPSAAGLAQVIVRLAETTDETSMKADIIRAIAAFAETPPAPVDAERGRRLLAELRAVPQDLFGDAWSPLLAKIAQHLEPREKEPAPPPLP